MLKAENNVLNDEKFQKEKNLKWKKPFYFVQAADTQFGLIRRWTYVEKGMKQGKTGFIDGEIKDWVKEKELSELTVKLVNEMSPKPKFMIICGDMLDQLPYKLNENFEDKTANNELNPVREQQYNDFVQIYSKINIPLICVCGNHDLGDKMTFKSVENYKREFGDTYFKFYLDGVLFIVLNSQLYFDPNECENLAEQQNNWLDSVLSNEVDQFKHVIVFQHHPLFTNKINEKETYFNLPVKKRFFLFEKLVKAGVKKVFTGHFHKNSIGKHEDFECIVTSAIGMQFDQSDNHGFRVVKVEENEISHEYYAILKDETKFITF